MVQFPVIQIDESTADDREEECELCESRVPMHESGFGLQHIQSQSTVQDVNPQDLHLPTRVEEYYCS